MAWERRWDPRAGGEQGPSVGSAVARPPEALPADLPQQLGHDLDLLAAAQQVAEGHAGDARHLHGVHQHHEPLQQTQGQEGVLEAVHGQAAARLVVPVLGTGTGVRQATGWKGGGCRLRG